MLRKDKVTHLLDSLVLSQMLYGAESWPIDAQMTKVINSFGTNAYCIIMTGLKQLEHVRNTTVLVPVSRNELTHTVYDRQLCFHEHMLWGTYSPHARIYTLYHPTHSSTRHGRPQTNYIGYIQKLIGLKINELVEASEDSETWLELVRWSTTTWLESIILSEISMLMKCDVCVSKVEDDAHLFTAIMLSSAGIH